MACDVTDQQVARKWTAFRGEGSESHTSTEFIPAKQTKERYGVKHSVLKVAGPFWSLPAKSHDIMTPGTTLSTYRLDGRN